MFSLAPTVFHKLLNSLLAGKNQEILHQNPDFFFYFFNHWRTRPCRIHVYKAARDTVDWSRETAWSCFRPGTRPHPLYHTSYVPSLTSLIALMRNQTSEGQGIVWIPTGQVQETELGLERNQVSQFSVLYSSLAPHTLLSHFQIRLLWV